MCRQGCEQRRDIAPGKREGNDAAREIFGVPLGLAGDSIGKTRRKRGECFEGLRHFGAILKRGGDRGTFVGQRTTRLDPALQPRQSARNLGRQCLAVRRRGVPQAECTTPDGYRQPQTGRPLRFHAPNLPVLWMRFSSRCECRGNTRPKGYSNKKFSDTCQFLQGVRDSTSARSSAYVSRSANPDGMMLASPTYIGTRHQGGAMKN